MNIVWQNSSKCYLQFVHKKRQIYPTRIPKILTECNFSWLSIWKGTICIIYFTRDGNKFYTFFSHCEKITQLFYWNQGKISKKRLRGTGTATFSLVLYYFSFFSIVYFHAKSIFCLAKKVNIPTLKWKMLIRGHS